MARLDRDRFEQLVRQHHAATYRSALRVLRHASDAEDVAQEVFVRALAGKVPLESAAGGTAAGTDRAALCWLATRLALNARRGARRRHHHEDRAAMATEPITPVQHATDAELRRAVTRLVDDLPDELRLPLVLRYQDELTFAAVGTALAISESTAHERVQNALGRLRQQLARAGVAAMPALPELVARAELPAAPVGFETRLLALGAATPVSAAVLAKLGAVAVLLTGATIAAIAFAGGERRDAVPERAPVVAAHVEAEAAPVADPARPPVAHEPGPVTAPGVAAGVAVPRSQDVPARAPVTFRGTVHDALSWPVAGARVIAVAGGGYKPFELAATRTDAGGAFALEVGAASGVVPATKIRIQVLEHTQVLLETREITLPASGEPEPLTLRLPEGAGTETSRFELAVAVRGPDGAPLSGVPVGLHAVTEPPPRFGFGGHEVQATTGADGVARLAGRKPGAKWLFADGRKLGFGAEVVAFTVDRPGEQGTTVQLRRGRTLHGQVNALDGAVLEWANVWLEDETTRIQHQTTLGSAGEIAFTALGDGPFTLHVDRHPYSPVALRGLRPDAAAVVVRLKRQSDEHDDGHHVGELHGRLVDAATREVVPFTVHQVHAHRVLAGESTLVLDRVQAPPPVQTMVDDTERRAFHLVGLGAGTWAITVAVPGFAKAVQLVELRTDELRAGIEVPLHRGARVAGRVLDADGQPRAGAFVFVTGIGDRADRNLAAWDAAQADRDRRGPAPGLLACSAKADADGRFVLKDVPPGTPLRVVAVAAGQTPAPGAAVVLQAGEERDGCELRLGRR